MDTHCPSSATRRLLVRTAASMLLPLCAAQPGVAQELGSAMSMADLEKAFWACDYAASTGSVVGPAASRCSAFTEELKGRKFDGDFDAMLGWWRERKPAEHAQLERRANDSAARMSGIPQEPSHPLARADRGSAIR